MKKPSLLLKPQLDKLYTRERWTQDAYDKNKSDSARNSRVAIISRLDHYCNKVHSMKPEEIFSWMKKESKTPEILTRYAVDFLSKYVKFCQKDHRDIIIIMGRSNSNTPNKKNYLHKLHDNSIIGNVVGARGFMSQVGGIRLHKDDMKLVPIPTVEKRGMYDDEDAEPLTSEQARNVIGRTRDHRSLVLYHFMNDTAFRISEAGMVIDSDFDFSVSPCTVKTPNTAVKGVKSRGYRYLRDTTAKLIKTLLADDYGNGDNSDVHYTFKKTNKQKLTAFRKVELKKIKNVYNKLGMNQVYEDTGRSKYNLHSWRKRCGTEYGRSNSESMADGYLRHSKYLAQYHLKTKEERIDAFKKAEIDLAIDGVEKIKLENQKKSVKITELEESKVTIDELKKRLDKQDKRDKILLEMSRLDKKLQKAIKENSDDLDELKDENIKLENEYEKLLDE